MIEDLIINTVQQWNLPWDSLAQCWGCQDAPGVGEWTAGFTTATKIGRAMQTDSVICEQAERWEGGDEGVGGEQMSEPRRGSKWVWGRESGTRLSASETEQVGEGLSTAS
jgi:hypothetical protein